MGSRMLTRRDAIAAAIGGVLAGIPFIGCDAKMATAAGEGMIAIGGLVLEIPHWLGKVIGAALITGGSALVVYFGCSDGSRKKVQIELTQEQMRKIERALAAGEEFTATDPKGNNEVVPPIK